MKGDLDGDSLYPSLPITEWTRYVPNPAEEIKKLNEQIVKLTEQVKELTESMKEFNKHLPVSEEESDGN
jgi:peptidoglycan hydrolase CwlO-like protein